MENEWKNSNFFKALCNSINGVKNVLKKERNIKIQIFFAFLAITLGFILKITYIEWAILVITIFLVLFAEFINTSIEITVDMITEKYNESAKAAKDIAAASVLLTAISSVIVGCIIILPKIIDFIK